MKKVKFSGKLNLNKETVAKLNDEQMKGINGGITKISGELYTCGGACNTRNTCAASACRFNGSVCLCPQQ